MKNKITLNPGYLICTIILLITEVLIALYAHDSILRAYIGDVLVVILIYCFIKSFFNTPVFITSISVLLFSFVVEAMQYFKLVTRLGLQHSKAAKIIIGTSFSWWDIVSYIAGIVIVLIMERLFKPNVYATKSR